jgi:glycosyltransferase involved in cell wall biosynthesis
MKVLHIEYGFSYPPIGGEQIRTSRVCDILSKKININLLYPSTRMKYINEKPHFSIEEFNYTQWGSKGVRVLWKNNPLIAEIKRKLYREKPAIIHHHFGTMPSLINAVLAGSAIARPQIATYHQFWPLCYRGSYWDFEGNVCSEKNLCGECILTVPLVKKVLSQRWIRMAKTVLGEINYHIPYSEFMKEKLKRNGVDEDKITVIPFGVDFDKIQSGKVKKKNIVFSGRLGKEKGVNLFIEALEGIKVKGIIIGDGPQRKEYEELAKDKKVDITFTGWINDREKYFQLLKSAICVVVPSVWLENFPLVIGEAFACETPVIGTNSGGIPELINNSGAGFVVERDAEEIAEKIQVLLEDEQLRDEMGKKGREYAEKHFNWDKNVERLVGVYEKVLSERR